MKTLIRTYKTILDGEIYKESMLGHCVTVEYIEEGIEERIIHVHSILAHDIKMYAMEVVIQRKNNAGNWVTVEKKTLKTSPNNWFDLEGNKVVDLYEMVDSDTEILDSEGNSFDPPQYEQVSQLRTDVIRETEMLSATIGNAALYPYFTRAIINNYNIV